MKKQLLGALRHGTILPATVIVLLCSMAHAANFKGKAVVVDGDTIELHVGHKVIAVRLCGIDSPEARHAGGPEASAKMAALIAGVSR
jgi:endonuclease YncB( thermonuclease family)